MEAEKIMALLVVGIGNYQKPIGKLKHCQDSAQYIYNLLTDSEFGFCKEEYSDILIGDDKKIINCFDIENSFKKIATKIKTAKEREGNVRFSFLFFFCGHGEVSTPDGDLILLMSNYCDEEKIKSVLYIENFFLELKRHLIDDVTDVAIIIDSCHSEAVSLSKKYCQSNKIGYMWSCSDIQESQQSPDLKKTFFSHYFCEKIKELAVNETVSIKELADYINCKIKLDKIKQKAGCNGNQNILIAKRKRTSFILLEHIQETINNEILPKIKNNIYYQIIDNPPEYGKTFLMQEIKKALEKEKCICFSIKINQDYEGKQDIFLNDLLSCMKIDVSIYSNNKNDLFTIIDFLNKKINELEAGGMCYLLVDIDKFHLFFFNFIVNGFLSKISDGTHRHNRIKFILAGRFLYEKFLLVNPEIRKNRISFSKNSYKFTKNALCDFVKKENSDKLLENRVQNNISIAAAHLFFLSGGHPGCIAHILQEYGSIAALFPDIFLKNQDGMDSCIEYINSRVSGVINCLDLTSQKYINDFSVLRYSNIEAIELFFDFSDSNDKKKCFDRAISSSNIFEIDRIEPKISIDDITRKIIVISF